MGEMAFYYAAADVAFVGGSLAPLGGHNLIEACACGCPVVVGRHTFNFAQATADAIAAGAAVVADDAAGVVAACAALAADAATLAQARRRALAFADAHRGAAERTVAAIRGLVSATTAGG
jgi:3-deoxy-D-manno-octulosonic-acid transferase